MASVGTITVKLRLDAKEFTKELNRLGDSYERYDARRTGTWNRYQMVGAR